MIERAKVQPTEPGLPPLALGLLLSMAGFKLLVHLALAGRYGYFRDELYFLDCARHLDWGYVDAAPAIGLYARIALLFGGSLPVLRGFSAIAGALLVLLAGLIARRLGGGRFAQALTALAVIVAPIYLATDSLFSMNAVEPLFWMGGVYVLIRILQGGDPRLWLVFGATLGLGMMNKHSALFFGLVVGAGLLLSPARRELRTVWPWLGAGLALLIFSPNLLWQIRHDFATLEDLRNVARTGKNVVLGPLAFLGQQVLLLHPVLAPLWLAGLVRLLLARQRQLRALGWATGVFFLVMFTMKAKHYYLAPIYPLLFAAGAVATEIGLERWSFTRGRGWAKAALLAVIAAAGAVLAPLVLPLLPPDRFLAYESALGLERPKTEVAHVGPLPQIFGDQFGWEELVAEVDRVYRSLPAEQRGRTGILASNYGEAGALHLFGPALGLPPAFSAHQNHYFWGPPETPFEDLIVLQWSREDLDGLCRSVEQVGVHHHPWGMAEENRPIYLCRGLQLSLSSLWPRIKHWN